tara:strand:+ start:67 stop:330 length:264 start_codon:yes stop_codon:yes gene_type:complete
MLGVSIFTSCEKCETCTYVWEWTDADYGDDTVSAALADAYGDGELCGDELDAAKDAWTAAGGDFSEDPVMMGDEMLISGYTFKMVCE